MPAALGSVYKSAADHVLLELRGLLYSGSLKPGARVSIDELAERFGVSRTPVRDAIFALRVEGLLTIEPRVGVFVRPISNEEVLDVYRIREALDPLVVMLATERSTPEERLDQLDTVHLLEMTASEHDVASYVNLLEQRRESLLAMARSEALGDTLRTIDGRVRLLRFRNLSQSGHLAKSAQQHSLIAQAIFNQDSNGAAIAMTLHTRDARTRIMNLLAAEASVDETGSVSVFAE